jgi:hypothetical protein
MAYHSEIACKGKDCVYYRKSYAVQKYGGGYIPDFNIVEDRCHHPKHFTPSVVRRDFIGVHISSLKKCPSE